MDHKPVMPEVISAAPRKKGSSSHTRSSGCACSFAAVYIATSVTLCTGNKLSTESHRTVDQTFIWNATGRTHLDVSVDGVKYDECEAANRSD